MARRSHLYRVMLLSLFLVLSAFAIAQQPANTQQSSPVFHNDVVIKGGTILTVTHGKIENGSIYIHNGKIAEVGQSVNAPATATVLAMKSLRLTESWFSGMRILLLGFAKGPV